MLAVSPLKPCECEVIIDDPVDVKPYDVVVPYSTSESDASLVVQEMVAVETVMFELATLEITGGVVSGGAAVVKVKSPDVARLPAASLDFTR